MPAPRSVRRLVRCLVVSAILGAIAAACAPHYLVPPRPVAAILLVENRSLHDVVVYLADGHVPLRLGRVAALGRSRLVVPDHVAYAGARLLVRSTDSGELFAPEPASGGALTLTVEPLLIQSTLVAVSFGH
jgi:hypothetical protein